MTLLWFALLRCRCTMAVRCMSNTSCCLTCWTVCLLQEGRSCFTSTESKRQQHVPAFCSRCSVFACSISDDLDIAPDFFEYFLATYPLLHSDPMLWCVSAWNDNGKGTLISNEAGTYISHFCSVIILIIDYFCIALFSSRHKITVLCNIFRHFWMLSEKNVRGNMFKNVIHIIMTANDHVYLYTGK